jgi:MoxR-like ATPase
VRSSDLSGPLFELLLLGVEFNRASQALMLAVRAKALIDGRLAPSVDDVVSLGEAVLKHRMALSFAARAEGETISGVIGRLTATLE